MHLNPISNLAGRWAEAAAADSRQRAAQWHALDVSPVWLLEFAAALSRQVPLNPWMVAFSWSGALAGANGRREIDNPRLAARILPVQRGFWRVPVLEDIESRRLLRRMTAGAPSDPRVLVCCQPQYARLVELWNGPSVYYATDLFRRYEGWPEAAVSRLEARMCRAATVVCPNSSRIANMLTLDSTCRAEKIMVLPNAARASSVLPEPALRPSSLPADLANLRRPVAGVIGNLGSNTDWRFLDSVLRATPWLSWAFVGPLSRVPDTAAARARDSVLAISDRVRCIGPRPYGRLAEYARAFDVAVLPYAFREPTFSGSSTRYYEHLAACRPMLATAGFAELLNKEPLVRICADAETMIARLEALRKAEFDDGLAGARWQSSLANTWERRSAELVRRIAEGA